MALDQQDMERFEEISRKYKNLFETDQYQKLFDTLNEFDRAFVVKVIYHEYGFDFLPMMTSLPAHLFHGCPITGVKIPNTITSIGPDCFRNSGLTYVVIPGSVKKIGKEAFRDCANLEKVEIEDGVEVIDVGAFSYCPKLTEVSLPKTVKLIGINAFTGTDPELKIYAEKRTANDPALSMRKSDIPFFKQHVVKTNSTSPIGEDTKKKKNGKWVNKGDDGEHGEFRTKKEADAQRKAMFANGYHEELTEENELEKRAKAHKKKQKGWGYFVHPNAGDVEKGIDMFNHMMKPIPPNADAATTASAGSGEGAPAGVSAGGGMGEELEEGLDRNTLITLIKGKGFNYKFDKYTDQQLFRIYQRILDDQRTGGYEDEPVADKFDYPHTILNDPKYNFDDPDREDDYEVE